MKKYELTDETIEYCGRLLYRIRALKDFSYVNKGDLGGYVKKEENLSQEGDCWIYGSAKVFDNAKVYGNASIHDYSEVYGNAEVYGNVEVHGYAEVYGDAKAYGYCRIYGSAKVFDNANVFDNAKIHDGAQVNGYAKVYGDANISDRAKIYGYSEVCGNSIVYGYSEVSGNAIAYGNAEVYDNAILCLDALIKSDADYTTIKGFGTEYRTTTFFRCKNNIIKVKCGCFSGTIEEFRNQVKKTREGKVAEEYLLIADLMEKHFK